MKEKNYSEMDAQHVWHPYTKRSAVDEGAIPVVVRGEGVYLYDEDGNRYLDAVSSWWSCNLGHSNSRLTGVLKAQADRLQHSILGDMTHPAAAELATRLAQAMPGEDYHSLFASDGASAVEAALKVSVQYHCNMGRTGRTSFASLHNAYHGDTLGAIAVGYLESFHSQFEALLPKVHQAESPCCSTCSHDVETCTLQCFESMEGILTEYADELAAVIVEPLCQGAGGMRIYSPRYISRLQERCREKDVLLILDEIAVGFGRTGKMFAFEHAGIEPDIACMGKGLSGGYLPISATVVRDDIYDTFADRPDDHTFYHGHTFAGNPIAAAVAVEVFRIYEEEGIVEQAARRGDILAAEMNKLADLPVVKDVRCLGMIGAVELVDDCGAAMARRVKVRMLEQGILIRPLGNVVYLMLPLVTPDDILVEAVSQLGDAISLV